MLIGRQPIIQSHGFSFQDNMTILGVKFNKKWSMSRSMDRDYYQNKVIITNVVDP